MHAGYQLGSDPSIAPGSTLKGMGYNIAWVNDEDVGVVVECNKVKIAGFQPS